MSCPVHNLFTCCTCVDACHVLFTTCSRAVRVSMHVMSCSQPVHVLYVVDSWARVYVCIGGGGGKFDDRFVYVNTVDLSPLILLKT